MSEKSKEIELQYSTPENAPVSKKGYFVSPIDKNWLAERAKKRNKLDSIMSVGGIVTSFATMLSLFGSVFFAFSDWGQVFSIAGGVALTGVSGSVLPFIHNSRKQTKAMRFSSQINATFVKDWLFKKYNLTINDENAGPISTYIIRIIAGTGAPTENMRDFFFDSKGDKYQVDSINANGNIEFFVVFLTSAKNDTKALKPKLDRLAIDASAENIEEDNGTNTQNKSRFVFPGEAETLYSSILDRLHSLEDMELDANERYSVDFVISELDDVISLYKNAMKLKSEESIHNQTVSALSDLNDELDRIALSEMTKIERKFAVKRTHFQDRKTNNEVKAIESLAEKDSTHV